MKIKRYFAPDIRQAMRLVREEQGPDAVILSNRRVEGGVEIVAALDFDEQALQDKLAEPPPMDKKPVEALSDPVKPAATEDAQPIPAPRIPPRVAQSAPRPPTPAGSGKARFPQPSQATVDLLARLRGASAPKTKNTTPSAEPVSLKNEAVRPAPPVKEAAAPRAGRAHAPAAPTRIEPAISAPAEFAETPRVTERQAPPAAGPGEDAYGSVITEMRQELQRLRKVVDMRLSEAGWQAASRNANTTRLDLLRGLYDHGFSKQLALPLANRLSTLTDSDLAWRQVKDLLTRQLPIADDQLLEYGGIAALVGPTGVGKTTTIAKLAAKFRLKHGPRQVALITIDNFRIAAHDHLHTYGRLLDVPVSIASNAEELQLALEGFLDKKLTLIDTAGMGQHDGRLADQLLMLKNSPIPIKPYLVMSAASQLRAMEAVVRAFSDCKPQACILTKMDEAAQPATALSVLIQQRLPLSFVADGQQVPEDLHMARARELIEACFKSPREDENALDGYDFEDWVAHGAS